MEPASPFLPLPNPPLYYRGDENPDTLNVLSTLIGQFTPTPSVVTVPLALLPDTRPVVGLAFCMDLQMLHK